jgi:hypothetical protein
MINPWMIIGGLMAVLAIGAGSFGFGYHVESLRFSAYQMAQTAAAEKQVGDNKTALLALQQKDQAALATINQTHRGALNEITQRRDALLTANRNLTERLWVSTASAGKQPTGVPKAGPSGPVDAQAGYTALPAGVGSWLVDQFTQADSDIATITALQQVVVHDREVCNGQLPGLTQTAADVVN